MAPKPLTPRQRRCLQGLAFGALHMNDVAKETFIAQVVPGKKAFHELTSVEAARVIDAMKRQAGQTPTRPIAAERRRARAGDVATLITPAQRALLEQLVQRAHDGGYTAAYVSGVLRRASGRQDLHTSGEAEKAIEALKALLERQAGRPEPA